MAERSLLPPNATPFERAQSETDAARWPLPTHLVSDIWNPATCPLDLLPYLAAGLGLEIWHDDWSEAYKRQVVANIWALKRNKTKLKGLIAYAALEQASVVAAHRPRDKKWWSGGQTAAQRAAQMAAMPQIHIATTAPSITGSVAKAFWSGKALRQAWSNTRYWVPSDAAVRYAQRATYVDKGVSTPIQIATTGPLDASMVLALAAPASVEKLFWGAKRFWGHAVYQVSDAESHVLAITIDPGAPQFAVPRGLVPVDVAPVRVSETVPVRPGQRFWGSGVKAGLAWGDGVYRASDASLHVYDRIALFDPTRLAPSRQPFSFWGWSRWGRPAYTAQIRVEIDLTRPARQHGYGQPWGRNFWRRSDLSPFWRALTALATAQAVRDTVWVDTRLYQSITFSAGLRFGDAGFKNFGDTKRLQ